MLITFKVIILYIIQVIISMQTSVKMGKGRRGGERVGRAISPGSEELSLHAEQNKIENLPLVDLPVRQGRGKLPLTSRAPDSCTTGTIFLFTGKLEWRKKAANFLFS